MPKPCCVYGCKTNYRSEKQSRGDDENEKIPVYRFPKDEFERERWIDVIGRINANLVVKSDTVVCRLHWPVGFKTKESYGKERPVDPPSVFTGIPRSIIPQVPSSRRSTSKTSCHERNTQSDQLVDFNRLDAITSFSTLCDTLLHKKRTFNVRMTAFVDSETLFIQSLVFRNGVPNFLIKISPSLKYETFHLGVKCSVSSLSKNRITKLDKWSKLEEALRFLNSRDLDNKMEVMQEHFSAMSPQCVGKPLYSQDMIVRAFEYFCTSRSLYQRLRHDYQLPSVQTLTRITSKVSKLSESKFLDKVFNLLPEDQKLCVLLHDEVYVKKAMLYHGGSLFGKAVNNPSLLASTVLGIMAVCLHGGPAFLTKMLPVASLKAEFIREQIDATKDIITSSGGAVTAVVCDNNRVNQNFVKSHDTVSGKPWLTTDGVFLLFDYVHIIKSIRNNWLTEKTGELQFVDHGGVTRVAKWSHLKQLYNFESENPLVKLSELNEVSVAPKPIERQKVATCLRVFCDKTCTALTTHPKMSTIEGREDTAEFIRIVVNFWKIMNIKGTGADIRHNDPREKAIDDPNDKRLDELLRFGKMALEMSTAKQGKRVRQLTKDTAQAINHTCNGIADLTNYLLRTGHKYVLTSKFGDDPLEKCFGKLRQGSGGAYFITVQSTIEKTNIHKSSLLLKLGYNTEELNVDDGHDCSSCGFLLDEEGAEAFDNLEELEKSIPLECKMALVYIAGYVTRKDAEMTEDELLDQTSFYYEKFGDYLNSLDRGCLNIPSDRSCQWVFFCFIMFNVVKEKVCRKSLCNMFMSIGEFHSFEMEKRHGIILSNIFLNNYCASINPRSSKESSLKVIKLSKFL